MLEEYDDVSDLVYIDVLNLPAWLYFTKSIQFNLAYSDT